MTTYTKQLWADNDATKPVSATRMLHIEDGIEGVDLALDQLGIDTAIADAALDGRLDTLEGQTLDARLDTLEGQTLDARLDTLEGQTLDTRLDALEALSSAVKYRLTSALVRTTAAYADLAGFSHNVEASTEYEFELDLELTFTGATTATSMQVKLVPTTTGIASSRAMAWIPAAMTGVDAYYEEVDVPTGDIGNSPGTNPGTTTHSARIIGRFVTNGTPGSIKFQGRLSTATGGGQVTFETGSRLTIRKVVLAN